MCRCKLGISISRYVHFGQKPLSVCLVKTFVGVVYMVHACVYICVSVSVDGWRGSVCCGWASVRLSAVV